MRAKARLTLSGSPIVLIVLTLILLLTFLLTSKPTRADTQNGVIAGKTLCTVTKYSSNPVLSPGANGTWDDTKVLSPVVLNDGSSLKMWYRGDDDTNPDQIGLATSTDGLVWTKNPANPVISPVEAWEINRIEPGAVISDTGIYKMWYTGYDSDWIGRIGYATSPDGVTWTKFGGNPVLDVGSAGSWDSEDVTGPAVIYDAGLYHMYYTGADGVAARIGHATSANGTSWTKAVANPVLDIGSPGAWDWLEVYSPYVIKVGAEYQLWYSGAALPTAWGSGYATSTDGSNWTRQRLIIPEGPQGSFDTDSADYLSVLVDGPTTRIWYAGLQGDTYAIGYAAAVACDQNANLPLVITSGSACTPLYVDDFSDPNSGWYIADGADTAYDYLAGQYEIFVKNPSWVAAVTPGALASDFSAQVTARRLAGNSGGYGLEFAINENWDSFYLFLIYADNYSVWRYQSGNYNEIKAWTYSSYLNTGTGWNKLKVVRNGSAINVFINDQRVGDFIDNNLTGPGRFGLMAQSPDNSSIKVRFDDFSLSTAACGLK